MRVSYEFYSSIGKRRSNEDYMDILQEKGRYCFAMADGAGGAPYGQTASKIAVETFMQMYSKEECSKQFIKELFELSDRMLNLTEDRLGYPKKSLRTTLATLLLDTKEHCFHLAHEGDSRIYVFRQNELVTRTKDHSVAQRLVDEGRMEADKLCESEEKKHITRMLGVQCKAGPDITDAYALLPNTTFLLCTDGFWNYITEEEMRSLLAESEFVGEWLAKMKRIVEERGMQVSMDNHSAMAVFVRD